MSDLDAVRRLARPEILELAPYAHAAWRRDLTRLHANEAPWTPPGDVGAWPLNRYPQPQPEPLLERLASTYQVPRERVLATRGSDEAIDVLSRVFLRAGSDAILQCTPTFGMYQVAARIQGAQVLEVPLERERGWELDAARLLAAWNPRVKLVYLCSPNNPTGNRLDASEVDAVCRALDGRALVVVDEAYVEWSAAPSLTAAIDRHATLVVLRTLSKAYALAGARVGALLARPAIVELARRVLPPYALAQPSVDAALRALDPAQASATRAHIESTLAERERLRAALAAHPAVVRVWPSDANFLLVACRDAAAFLAGAQRAGILVRDMRAYPQLGDAVRITVGTPIQNDALLRSL